MFARKVWRYAILQVAIVLLCLLSKNALAVSDPCSGGRTSNVGTSNVTILFVNGIFNTLTETCNSSAELIKAMPDEARTHNFQYIWNPDSWLDVVELLDQEIISSRAVEATLISEGVFNRDKYYEKLGEVYQRLTQDPSERRTVVTFTRSLHNEMERLLSQGQSLVVVPHSQGNHMIEAAYSMFVFHASLDPSKAWKLSKIKVVGVANVAHTTPSTKYITIAEDGALASFEVAISFGGLASGRPSERNYAVCTSFFDFQCRESVKLADWPTGHGFQEVYLNSHLKDSVLNNSIKQIVVQLVQESISGLTTSTNCGTVSSPQVVGQQGPSYFATTGQPITFTATYIPKPGATVAFERFKWHTEPQGADSSGPGMVEFTNTFTTCLLYTSRCV